MGMMRTVVMALVVLLSGIAAAVSAEPPLTLDAEDMGARFGWTVRNGNAELGEVGQAAPGSILNSYFQPSVFASLPERNCFPVTAEEAGNRYLLVPGYKGLAEYNLSLVPFRIDRDGQAELSFRARWVNGDDGQYHDDTRVSIDFRCRNADVEYGSVSERYPVLESRGCKLTKEWQTFTYTVPVKKGFRYLTWFRVSGRTASDALNGLCIDDIRLTMGQDKAFPEISLRLTNAGGAYSIGERVLVAATALLPGNMATADVAVHVRRDWENDTVKKISVKMLRDGAYRSADGRSRYTGSAEFTAERFGSFNMTALAGNDPVAVLGGDFVVLHTIGETSPLQRKLGGHYRLGHTWGSLADNSAAASSQNGLGIESIARDYARAGLRHGMYAFDLKRVQPEAMRMDFTLADEEIAQLEKAGVKTIGCFGGWWIYTDRSKRGDALVGALPDWFYDDRYTRALPATASRKTARTLTEDVWRFHVNEIIARYGDRIRTWMVQVEPQWVLPADEYAKLQKIAYEAVKKNDPSAFFIAGDATSDAGYNLTGWFEKLHAQGFEKYLDAASFNPYGSSLDYINGERFRYSGLIERIRNILAPGTALWEQELYYIANSKRPWKPGEQSVFSAGDAQRHYLLGLLHGLRGITAIDGSAVYKFGGGLNRPDTTVLGDVSAGINALSHFLEGKRTVERVGTASKLIHAGLFTGDGEKASGVLWALSPSGMGLRLAESAGVTFHDNFGNTIAPGAVLTLGLDPIFLTGTPSAIRALLTKSSTVLAEPVAVRTRSFGDRTVIEVQNLTGAKNVIAMGDAGFPPVQVPFMTDDAKRFVFKGKLAKAEFRAGLAGDTELQAGVIKPLPDTGHYVLPDTDGLALSAGSDASVRLWAEGGMLRMTVRVKDAQVTAAPDENVWNGDAAEVFIDRAPFTRMDIDDFNGKNIPGVSVRQYMFAAVPTAKGGIVRTVTENASGRSVTDSRAETKAIDVDGGWGMEIAIPLSEAVPLPGNDGIIGLNIEIARRDGERSLPKFRLFGTASQESYRKRLHYALFKAPGVHKNLVLNGSAEAGMSGWSCIVKTAITSSDDGWSGRSARIELNEKPSWGPTLHAGRMSVRAEALGVGKYLMRCMVRGQKINSITLSLPGGTKREFKGAELPLPDRWTAYEAVLEVTEAKPDGYVAIAALTDRAVEDAWYLLDDVELYRRE